MWALSKRVFDMKLKRLPKQDKGMHRWRHVPHPCALPSLQLLPSLLLLPLLSFPP